MRKNSLSFVLILIILIFTGCSNKTTIEPLVSNCCENGSDIKTNKKIFVGNFTLKDANNIKNIYGSRVIKSDFEDIIFKESYNDIVRRELFKKLQKISKNVHLVNQKPNSLNENDSVYIEGYIEKIWIKQQVPIIKTKFNTNSVFDFKITSIVNEKLISDDFNAKLELIVQDIQVENRQWTRLLNTFGDGSEVAQNIKHRLNINNELIADFDYFQFLESQIANFTTDYEVIIKGNIYGKYPQVLDDTSKGNVNKFEIYDMAYSYFSPNLNTSSGYNFGFENTCQKKKLKKLVKTMNYKKKDYDECEKNKILNEDCMSPITRNIETTKYYDIFRLYTTNSGILQYISNIHIDKIISEINNTLKK